MNTTDVLAESIDYATAIVDAWPKQKAVCFIAAMLMMVRNDEVPVAPMKQIAPAAAQIEHATMRQREPKKRVQKQPSKRPWTKDDLAELKAYCRQETSVAKIARQMNRTQSAVRQRARALQLIVGHRRSKRR